jgi:type 1 glutamine amidotransferase
MGKKPIKRALCTWGGDIHTPEISTKMMVQALEKDGFQCDVKHGLKCLESKWRLKKYDLIVYCHTGVKITKKQRQNLINAVMNGAGLAGWHGGLNDSLRSEVDYQFMTGAKWVSHPGAGGMTYQVNMVPEKKNDPIIQGLKDFTITSEQYYLHIDPALEVIATTTFHSLAMPWIEGVVMPVAYKKRWGKGKIFYVSVGHTNKDFEIPEAMELMRRGMLWAAQKEDIKVDVNSSQNTLSKAF